MNQALFIGIARAIEELTNQGVWPMEAYQERVLEEKRALDEKVLKLTTFIDGTESGKFAELSADERDRLIRQRVSMMDYASILGERIAAFKDDGVVGDRPLE